MSSLVVQGNSTWTRGSYWLAAAGVAGSIGAGLAIEGVVPPWLEAFPREIVAVTILVGSAIFGVVVQRLVGRRSIALAGRVVLDEAKAFFERGLWNTSVPFTDLAGYRDAESHFVELVRRDGVRPSIFFPRLTVPTLTEAERTAVLRVLDERGLSRLE